MSSKVAVEVTDPRIAEKGGYAEYRCVWTTQEVLPGSLKPVQVRWHVYRRYKEFFALDAAVRKQYGYAANGLTLPPKKMFGNLDSAFIMERCDGLQRYMSRLLNSINGIAAFDQPHLCCAALKAFMKFEERLQLAALPASLLAAGGGSTGAAAVPPASSASSASAASSVSSASPGSSTSATATATVTATASSKRLQSRSAALQTVIAPTVTAAAVTVAAPTPPPLPSATTYAASAPKPAAAPAPAPAPAPVASPARPAAPAAPAAAAGGPPRPPGAPALSPSGPPRPPAPPSAMAPPPAPPSVAAILPPAAATPDRGNLLASIRGGAKLKKAPPVNDRSAPKV